MYAYTFSAMASTSPLKGAPLRNPGQSLEDEIQRLYEDRLLPYVLFPGVMWVLALMELLGRIRNAPRAPGIYALAAFVLTLFAVLRVGQLRAKVRALKLGRDGEKAVGQFLESLRVEGARIFHDIPADGFNLDHVVVSTHGIFAVETKTISKPSRDARITIRDGQIFAGGRAMDRNPLTQVTAGADWLLRELEASTGKKLPVRGVVVFPGWFVERMEAAMTKTGPWVLEPKALPSFIEHEPEALAPSDVSLAAYHLSRYVRTYRG